MDRPLIYSFRPKTAKHNKFNQSCQEFAAIWGRNFGVPQDRLRIYILGAKRSSNVEIQNPPLRVRLLTKEKCTGLKPFLMQRNALPASVARKKRPLSNSTVGKKKMKLSKTAVANLREAKKRLENQPTDVEVIVDLAAGKKFCRVTEDYAPTLLAGRCSSRSYYLLKDCLSSLI